MPLPVKLELGAGHRPTPGYEHNDLHPFEHVEHVGSPWMLELPDGSVDEVLALGLIEHLTFYQACDTFRNVHRMLRVGGEFLFDVPDYPVWARYYLDALNGVETPVTMEHIRKTLFGWARWPGDEHKYGWDLVHLTETLHDCGFFVSYGVSEFEDRTYRARFTKPADAHLYVSCMKP